MPDVLRRVSLAEVMRIQTGPPALCVNATARLGSSRHVSSGCCGAGNVLQGAGWVQHCCIGAKDSVECGVLLRKDDREAPTVSLLVYGKANSCFN